MSKSHPDYMEGLYLPLFLIAGIVILYFKFPTASIIIGILLVTFIAGFICAYMDVPIWLNICVLLGSLIGGGFMYFHQIPLLYIGGIIAGLLFCLSVWLAMYFWYELHILVVVSMILATIGAGSVPFFYMESYLLSSISIVVFMQFIWIIIGEEFGN